MRCEHCGCPVANDPHPVLREMRERLGKLEVDVPVGTRLDVLEARVRSIDEGCHERLVKLEERLNTLVASYDLKISSLDLRVAKLIGEKREQDYHQARCDSLRPGEPIFAYCQGTPGHLGDHWFNWPQEKKS